MKIEEQYLRITNLKRDINDKLNGLNFDKIKELMLWLAGESNFSRLKNKDNQLLMLEFTKNIWLEEKKRMNDFEMQGDAFWGINSLDDVERKYRSAHFAALRIENDMPKEICVDALQELIKNKYSAFYLYSIIIRETEQMKSNILQLSKLLKEQNEMILCIGLLKLGTVKFPEEQELLLELADSWIIVQQYDKAYECMKKIAKPNEMIKEMLLELEKVLDHEEI